MVVLPIAMVPLPAVVGAPIALAVERSFMVLMLNVPFWIAVVPVYVFVPERVRVPVPVFTIEPVPLITPA